ncbi:Uncharacterized protein TCM_044639 [Theobroma cacao]|uniref:Uncharacterized protein n=1 Tax=Theobroma cacao TaxID=3641 RepID=A0A061FRH0_THECC|nr:Uncharacterized protein TCM_044639 [Theobroma cacao]
MFVRLRNHILLLYHRSAIMIHRPNRNSIRQDGQRQFEEHKPLESTFTSLAPGSRLLQYLLQLQRLSLFVV